MGSKFKFSAVITAATVFCLTPIFGLTEAEASTAQVFVTAETCVDQENGSINDSLLAQCAVSFSGGSAFAIASATAGRLGAAATAISNPSNRASALASFSELVTVNGLAEGFVRVNFAITGSLSINAGGQFFGSVNANFGRTEVNWSVGDDTGFRRTDLSNGTFGSLISQSFGGFGTQNSADLSFQDGSFFMGASIGTRVFCGANLNGCTAISNYRSTLTFLSAQVFDANGELAPEATLSSESGFDYLNGAPPVIPLPAGLPLLLAGLGAIGVLRRRAA